MALDLTRLKKKSHVIVAHMRTIGTPTGKKNIVAALSCDRCVSTVGIGDVYCSHCGSELDWSKTKLNVGYYKRKKKP